LGSWSSGGDRGWAGGGKGGIRGYEWVLVWEVMEFMEWVLGGC